MSDPTGPAPDDTDERVTQMKRVDRALARAFSVRARDVPPPGKRKSAVVTVGKPAAKAKALPKRERAQRR